MTLCTSQKIGTGFDEKSACSTYNGIRINLMILTGSTKTPELLEQWAGRGMNFNKPTIIHIVDDMAIIKRYWTSANKWYKSRNATITKFNSQYYNKKSNL
ncbi:unnamed protein product [marine sediment metagenome]|uniref:Helicase C-terminal domain-containing protein n=1 Tax=marine sediment metagenome TaxID=412755 RepID=X0WGN8_9ZZZZ